MLSHTDLSTNEGNTDKMQGKQKLEKHQKALILHWSSPHRRPEKDCQAGQG